METDIIHVFQGELGRLMSPIEIEILEDWKSQGFSESTIRDALKETIFCGRDANCFKYINKILQNWKSAEDAANTLVANNTETNENKETEQEPDLSWLN